MKDEVLSCADDGETEAMTAASHFEWQDAPYFDNFWDYSLKEYTCHYLWCCYAIVWGIRQYDAVAKPELPLDVRKRSLRDIVVMAWRGLFENKKEN